MLGLGKALTLALVHRTAVKARHAIAAAHVRAHVRAYMRVAFFGLRIGSGFSRVAMVGFSWEGCASEPHKTGTRRQQSGGKSLARRLRWIILWMRGSAVKLSLAQGRPGAQRGPGGV